MHSPAETVILDSLAVAHDELTLTHLRTLISRAGIRPEGKAVATDHVRAWVGHLEQQGELKQIGGRAGLGDRAEPRFREIWASGRYRELVDEVASLEPLERHSLHHWGIPPRPGKILRELRRALMYQDDEDLKLLHTQVATPWYTWFTGDGADPMWAALSPFARTMVTRSLSDHSVWYAMPHGLPAGRFTWNTEAEAQVAAREAWLRGDLATFTACLEQLAPKGEHRGVFALRCLDEGNPKGAATHLASMLALYRKRRTGGNFPVTLEMSFIVLTYLLVGTPSRVKQAEKLIGIALSRELCAATLPWGGWLNLERLIDDRNTSPLPKHPIAVWMAALVSWWSEEQPDARTMAKAIETARGLGWSRVADELEAGPQGSGWVTLRQVQAPWMNQLDQLASLIAPSGRGNKPAEASKRLAWTVYDNEYDNEIELEARLQSRKGTKWSAGRKVATARLTSDAKLPRTPADMAIIAGLQSRTYRSYSGYPETQHTWDPAVCWPALLDHPAVFGTDGEPLQLVRRVPQIVVEEQGSTIVITLDPPCPAKRLHVEAIGGGFEVTVFNRAQQEISAVIQEGLHIPVAGRKRVEALLTSMEGVFERQQADTDLWTEADPRPVVLLRPVGSRIAAQIVVRPAGPDGPELAPGSGSAVILGTLEGRAQRFERDLGAERANADVVLGLPGLREATELAHGHWRLESSEEALLFLEAAREAEVTLFWPEGETLKLRRMKSTPQLSLRSVKQWFEASGAFELDDDLTVSLAEILKRLLRGSGRFIQLDDGSFLSLELSLRKELDTLARVSTPKGESAKVHPLALTALQRWTSDATVTMSAAARKRLEKLQALPTEVALPGGLQATLRGYQEDGYRWLVRMGALDAGALLADDMGLGKTLTTLALLLQRRSQGPALVVAPTSVAGGWMNEALRFTPGLKMIRLRASADRQATLDALGAGDVLVCSYGLLVSEAKPLAKLSFSTAVFDECQALKTPSTQRHKAAKSIDADFRIGLTGTPIENHLGELHAQLEILIPGLLGSRKGFKDRFIRPIEAGDRAVRKALSATLSPLLLRRTKGEVLQDLPARTDIEVPIELTAEEATLYEAQREHALAAIAASEGGTAFAMLPHLTKLRLLACSPALVVPSYAPEGSKTKAFRRLARDLVESGHKALVFSQFVKHLDLLSACLEDEGLAHYRLQGSTPAMERDRLVREFQSGDTPLFLISLRAGGTGLNLTAADYVIHMDPWWNPAVEDQASDRAHRIGQQRPVTVYRLIAAGTVEQQILELHRTKRSLAEQVLEGTDAAGRLTAEQLLSLIRG